jgi:proteasome lid subunit RPN8/RPN11
MGVEISRGVLQRILAHAASAPEREVCGLMLGTPALAEVATENVSANPADSFEIDPAALFAALRAERTGGPRLIGHYHSHPNGLATPSERDAMMATSPGRLWLIVASGEARLWSEVPGGAVHGAFEPVELLTDGADEGCA